MTKLDELTDSLKRDGFWLETESHFNARTGITNWNMQKTPEIVLARYEKDTGKLCVSRKIVEHFGLDMWDYLQADSRFIKFSTVRMRSGQADAKNYSTDYCAIFNLSEAHDPHILRGKKNYKFNDFYVPDFIDECNARGGEYVKLKGPITARLLNQLPEDDRNTKRVDKLITSMQAFKDKAHALRSYEKTLMQKTRALNKRKKPKAAKPKRVVKELKNWLQDSENSDKIHMEQTGRILRIWVPAGILKQAVPAYKEDKHYKASEMKHFPQCGAIWAARFVRVM